MLINAPSGKLRVYRGEHAISMGGVQPLGSNAKWETS